MIPSDSELNCVNGNFLCGVVEGFYGRPWTSTQRKTLFQRMKKMGLNTYLYAPKDDCKHRMYWREQYSVEEAEALTTLIQAAEESDVSFVYAISPGLDITFSSSKDVTLLKKKLEQVVSFGCKSFALLFDDIETEMSEADKQIFQSFAHAQVSVTNEVYQHLHQPNFLFCPTEYCSTRAVPNVPSSEYLNTVGAKLLQGIDIMWTGPQVVSKKITIKHIEELSKVIQRPPVIWDNIHANDYDRKRMFLGPYDGRSPALIPHLRGVLTNPNCEYEANYIAMHTLAQWSKSDNTGSNCGSLPSDSPLRAEICLETESDYPSDDEMPGSLHSAYKPKVALTMAIADWYEEMLSTHKPVVDKIAPPPSPTLPLPNPPIAPPVSDQPIGTVPLKNLNELNNLELNSSYMQPAMSTVVLNSLVESEPSVDSDVESTAGSLEPMDCTITPGSTPTNTDAIPVPLPEKVELALDNADFLSPESGVEISTDVMQVDDSIKTELKSECPETESAVMMSLDDVSLFVDLFYLPFEHGSHAVDMLLEFFWLRTNAHVMCDAKNKGASGDQLAESETWYSKASHFQSLVHSFNTALQRFCNIPNKAIIFDLFPYLWDMKNILEVTKSLVNWLALGELPYAAVYNLPCTPYTWANRQYREAFTSGDKEPWVFQGGVQTEFQRMLPLDSVADLLLPVFPPSPVSEMYDVRPFTLSDENNIGKVCLQTCDSSLCDGSDSLGGNSELAKDSMVGAYLTLSPEYCFVIEDKSEIKGFVCASLNARLEQRKMEIAWLPEMKLKYPESSGGDLSGLVQQAIHGFHQERPLLSDKLLTAFPSSLALGVLAGGEEQLGAARRALACAVAALKCNGSCGVHVLLPAHQTSTIDFYTKLGFFDITSLDNLPPDNQIILGRSF